MDEAKWQKHLIQNKYLSDKKVNVKPAFLEVDSGHDSFFFIYLAKKLFIIDMLCTICYVVIYSVK